MTLADLIRINPFDMDTKVASAMISNTLVPETSTSQSLTSPPTSTTTQSLPDISYFSPTQLSHEILHLFSSLLIYVTPLNFLIFLIFLIYPILLSFASFITSVHHLSGPASQRDDVRDPL